MDQQVLRLSSSVLKVNFQFQEIQQVVRTVQKATLAKRKESAMWISHSIDAKMGMTVTQPELEMLSSSRPSELIV